MSFLKITDPAKRREMVNEYTRLRKKVYQDSLIQNQDTMEAKREQIKNLKPLINTQNKNTQALAKLIVPPLKAIAERKYEVYPQLPMIKPEDEPVDEPEEEQEEEEKYKIVGPIPTKIINEAYGTRTNDVVFGFREQDGDYMMGNKKFDVDGNDIIIGDTRYKGTPGLWKLIVSKDLLSKASYTAEDLQDYKEILFQTSALKANYNPNSTIPKANRSAKWIYLLKPIWDEQKRREAGADGKGIVYLSSDPIELCDRLDLLMAANEAGNSAVRNEIVSILDTLKKIKWMDNKQYKKINNIIK